MEDKIKQDFEEILKYDVDEFMDRMRARTLNDSLQASIKARKISEFSLIISAFSLGFSLCNLIYVLTRF